MRKLAAIAATLSLVLVAGCAGGPFGMDLGRAKLTIRTTAAGDCFVELINGKDLTNLDVTGLSVCKGSLGKLHLDGSNGSAQAMQNNVDVTNHALDITGNLAGKALGIGAAVLGSPASLTALQGLLHPPKHAAAAAADVPTLPAP